MVKLGLNMIVKNEAHIIHEVMTCTLGLIDTYVIVDTGSTDNTIQVINDFYKKHNIIGHVFQRPWKNFGHNRSEALKLCDGKMDYCMVIDADDLFNFPSNGRKILHDILESQKPNNVTVKIHEGGVIYSRAQIFKMNDGWKYIGVLHEYAGNNNPNNKTVMLPDEFFMTSRRLGGRNLTGDKQKKDIALLEQGIKDEPDNERYMYYLAQSYLDAGRIDDAIKWYKKRFNIGRWLEESFHAGYKVGDCYRRKGDIIKFEEWMQKAYKRHPKRAEPVYCLANHFRQVGEFYKAYHYIQIGRKISYPKDDVLFVENFAHNGGFDYEASIVEFYTHSDKTVGLTSSIQYLLKLGDFVENVVSNMKFYVTPISSFGEPLNIPSVFGEDFRPSAVSLLEYPYANVRFVNYLRPIDGKYRTKDGSDIQTNNAYINLETGECVSKMDDTSVDMPKLPTNVKGLEDVRLFSDKFIAVSYHEYSTIGDVQIVTGNYDGPSGKYSNCKVIKSPTNSSCEKNWLPIPNTDLFIYKWSPLQIGKIIENDMVIVLKHSVPPLFNLFRGSTPPISMNNKLWSLVHFVEHSTPRVYHHCFVELDPINYIPLRVTLPFCFKSLSVEYCLSCRVVGNSKIECYVSFMDGDPHKVVISVDSLRWINLPTPINVVDTSIIRHPSTVGVYWAGLMSACYPNNAIEKFVSETIKSNGYKASAIFSQTDGFVGDEEMKIIQSTASKPITILSSEQTYKNLLDLPDKYTEPIVCTIATRGFDSRNILHLPLDDETFAHGIQSVMSKYKNVPWNEKKSCVFWRGNKGGYENPSKRMEIVAMLNDHPNTDVKMALLAGEDTFIPEEHKAPRCTIDDHLKYKYLLIIDGVCIASNHQWVFSSGSVPIMITHPKNNYWYKDLLNPMVNYVPINYDLSDLKEKIDWLVSHDEEASTIAQNALKFSKIVFEPLFQRYYIEKKLKEIVQPPDAKIAFITAIYGNYEASCKKYVKQTVPTDFICFTDNKYITSNGWIIDTTPYHNENPSSIDDASMVNSLKNNKHTFNIAKYYKQAFQNVPRLKKYDAVVWLDGTIEITNKNTSEWILSHIDEHKIIGWEHEWRGGVLKQEVDASNFPRYTSTRWNNQDQPFQNIFSQYNHYLEDGYDENFFKSINPSKPNFGVWITCFVAFLNKDASVKTFLDTWYEQTLRYTTQDQIGFPYVCQKLKMIPYTLPDDTIHGTPHTLTNFYIKHDHGK